MKSINHPNALARLIQFLIHPVVVFIGLQVVWLAIIILWIIWFVNQNETLAALAISIGEKNSSQHTRGSSRRRPRRW